MSVRKTRSPAKLWPPFTMPNSARSEEHTSELQSRPHLVCRLLLEKKKQARGSLPDSVMRQRDVLGGLISGVPDEPRPEHPNHRVFTRPDPACGLAQALQPLHSVRI